MLNAVTLDTEVQAEINIEDDDGLAQISAEAKTGTETDAKVEAKGHPYAQTEGYGGYGGYAQGGFSTSARAQRGGYGGYGRAQTDGGYAQTSSGEISGTSSVGGRSRRGSRAQTEGYGGYAQAAPPVTYAQAPAPAAQLGGYGGYG